MTLVLPAFAQEIRSYDFIYRNIDERPNGLGIPAVQRQSWDYLAQTGVLKDVIAKAEAALKKNYRSPLPDNYYLDYANPANRVAYENEINVRRADLRFLTIAECVEGRGRFLPQIEQMLRSFCAAKTWVHPASDRQHANFRNQQTDIDPSAATLAWDLATVVWLHSNKLSGEVQTLVSDNLKQRIFVPFRGMVNGNVPAPYWLTADNNSNVVCLTSIAGAAMANLVSRKDRAFYVAACIDNSRKYIDAFPDDGYCRGGIGYWVQGFGHYLIFAEMVFENTKGKLNLIKQDSEAVPPAFYPDQIKIGDNFYPAFADSSINASISSFWPGLRDRLLSRASIWWRELKPDVTNMSLPQVLVAAFLPKPEKLNPEFSDKKHLPLRSFFTESGVLVCRPDVENKACRLAAAMKAGINFFEHHHNDVGSYVLGLDNIPVVLDPGLPANVNEAQRIDNKIVNSYGHSLPVIEETLQIEGKNASGKNVDSNFSRTQDLWSIDLSSVYRVAGLESLIRTFIYVRSGNGSFTVTDSGRFTRPVTFETAVITLGKWKKINDNSFLLDYQGRKLLITVSAADAEFELSAAPLQEQLPNRLHPLRIAIRLKEKTASPTIKIVYTPYTAPAVATH